MDARRRVVGGVDRSISTQQRLASRSLRPLSFDGCVVGRCGWESSGKGQRQRPKQNAPAGRPDIWRTHRRRHSGDFGWTTGLPSVHAFCARSLRKKKQRVIDRSVDPKTAVCLFAFFGSNTGRSSTRIYMLCCLNHTPGGPPPPPPSPPPPKRSAASTAAPSRVKSASGKTAPPFAT